MKPLLRPLDALIADDDPMITEVLSLMVEAMGCRVTTVSDGMAALELLGRQSFDVLITDWQMPHLDGIGLVRRLRSERSDNYLHIVMMTTHAAERTVRDGLDVEVDDFLFKPVDPVRLELAIASARRSIDLQRRLARRNRHLLAMNARARAAYRQIKNDLEAASATQRHLLPPMTFDGPLRHAWLFIPSLGIGGDTLDVRRLADGRSFFFQLDVSGHGIPAALRSFALHHRLSARPPTDPDTMLAMVRALNRDAQDEAEGAYYTMLCGIAAADGSRVDYIRAGHPLPFLVHAGEARQLDAGDPPVGLLPNLLYTANTVLLAPGDRLIIHSDGIADCRNPQGETFGEARLAAFSRDHGDVPLVELTRRLEAELRQFREMRSFEDDVSLLVIERGPAGGN